MNAWLTPDAIPADTACVRLLVPNDVSLIAAVFGALLTLTEAENWEQYGTQTPEDTAQAMLNMYEAAAADAADCGVSVGEVNLWHARSVADVGAAIVPSFASTVYHSHIALQSPAAVTDRWHTASFHLSAGDYKVLTTEYRTTANGVLKYELRRVSDNVVVADPSSDQYNAVNTPFLGDYQFLNVPEDDYYIRGQVTGKHASSTGYQVRLSLIQLRRFNL